MKIPRKPYLLNLSYISSKISMMLCYKILLPRKCLKVIYEILMEIIIKDLAQLKMGLDRDDNNNKLTSISIIN